MENSLQFLILFLSICFLIIPLTIILFFQVIKFFQKPKLDKQWDSLFKHLPEISHNEKTGEIFVKNIRNTKYKENSEFKNEVNFLNKHYNLNNLSKIWLMLNPWAPFQSHAILSFQFGEHILESTFLTASYEVRKVNPLDFYTSQTVFKNFEGHYILATENDVLYVRTNIRKDNKLYLFPLNIEKEKCQKIFLNLTKEINSYSKQPFFYRIWRRNCLTETFKFFKQEKILNYSFFGLLNAPKLIYKNNLVENISQEKEIPFKEFLEKNKIHVPVNAKQDEHFSFKIRELFINRNHTTN